VRIVFDLSRLMRHAVVPPRTHCRPFLSPRRFLIEEVDAVSSTAYPNEEDPVFFLVD
jgi:hypothetical protein